MNCLVNIDGFSSFYLALYVTKRVIEREQSIMGTIFFIFKVNTVEKVLRDLFQLVSCILRSELASLEQAFPSKGFAMDWLGYILQMDTWMDVECVDWWVNLNLNSLLVIRQMTVFHQGGSDGGEIRP